MSDAILERIAKALETIATAKPAAPAAPKPTPAAKPGDATKPGDAAKPDPDAAKKAAAKAAAEKKAAAATASKPAKVGKYDVNQVREMIRKVATNDALGKLSAVQILTDDGGGAPAVKDLKPEFYDAVYEACQVMLQSEGGDAAASDPDEDFLN